MANLGAEGKLKITIEGVENTEVWNASSGCGIVVEAVDRQNRTTIDSIAVPLKTCTAMAADISGVQRIDCGSRPIFNKVQLGKL